MHFPFQGMHSTRLVFAPRARALGFFRKPGELFRGLDDLQGDGGSPGPLLQLPGAQSYDEVIRALSEPVYRMKSFRGIRAAPSPGSPGEVQFCPEISFQFPGEGMKVEMTVSNRGMPRRGGEIYLPVEIAARAARALGDEQFKPDVEGYSVLHRVFKAFPDSNMNRNSR